MKERLTGAIILVALIVVLVPELLNGPLRPAARVHGPATPAEEPPLRSYTINLADEPRGGSTAFGMQPAGSSPPAPAADPAAPARAPPSTTAPTATAVPTPAVRATATPPTASPSTLAASTSKPPTSAPPAPLTSAPAASGSGYVVQLGSFASRANAERLAQQVHGLGYTVSVSRGSAGRRLYRVQVGPARERTAAEQLAAKLRTQGHGGAVVAK